MVMKEIINKLKELKAKREKEFEVLDDSETRDKHLRSLRRERRTQMEEIEKEKLIKEVAEFKKARMRKHLFGIKDKKEKITNLKKKVDILRQDNGIMNGKAQKTNNQQSSFLGKSNL